MKKNVWQVFVAVAFAALQFAAAGAVGLEGGPGAWRLMRDGREYFITGAGGDASKAMLAAIGGNSFRTWAADGIAERLDEAAGHGLTVMCGFWLGHVEHGFDYSDRAALDRTEAEVLATVRRNKGHPALLAWALGNEAELNNPKYREYWEFVDRLAGKVKAIDPDHPVCTVVAEIPQRTLDCFSACGNLDFLGINSYGGAPSLSERWRKAGMKRPYVVTEFGARGSWEGPRDANGIPLEPTSSEKGGMFAAALDDVARGRAAGCCLGSYAFAWGWKVESTPTWHGMLLPGDLRTASVDAVQSKWGRVKVANHSPSISPIKVERAGAEGVFTAGCEARDQDGDRLAIKWALYSDTGDYTTVGTGLKMPPSHPEALVSGQGTAKVRVRLPGAGVYRLYVFVYDGRGAAAYANVPLKR